MQKGQLTTLKCARRNIFKKNQESFITMQTHLHIYENIPFEFKTWNPKGTTEVLESDFHLVINMQLPR